MQRGLRHLACALLLVAAAMIALHISVPAFAAQDASPAPEYASWDDLAGATVGMVTGATFESALREKCPGVGDVVYYSLRARCRIGSLSSSVPTSAPLRS